MPNLNQITVEARQFTGTILSRNALQIWLLTGDYSPVDDSKSEKVLKDTVLIGFTKDAKKNTMTIKAGDWLLLDAGNFIKIQDTDFKMHYAYVPDSLLSL